MDYNQKWAFAIEAYSGSGGFDDKSYIMQHSREADSKYKDRQELAYYSNIFVQKIERYVGYLFKEQPIRASKNSLIKQVFDDCDNAGNSMNVFMSGFSKTTKVRGVGLVLVDMPKVIPASKGEQISQRALPYFVELIPENVTEYNMDKFGKFEYIAYTDEMDNSVFGDEDKTTIVRYYDKTEWRIYDEDQENIIDRGNHNLGVCPVIYVGENGSYPDVGEFTQVSAIAKRHFNLESEMDDILRGQTFSILTIQADNPSDVEITLSTDNAIKYGKGMTAPSFIAPNVSPADTYEGKIKALESRIDDITYDITSGLSAESGIALGIKFQGLNGSLANFAMRLQDFEQRAFEIVGLYLQSTVETTIIYPNSFDITDLEGDIRVLKAIRSLGYEIPTYYAIKMKQILSNDMSSVGNDDLNKIHAEIDDGLKEEK